MSDGGDSGGAIAQDRPLVITVPAVVCGCYSKHTTVPDVTVARRMEGREVGVGGGGGFVIGGGGGWCAG